LNVEYWLGRAERALASAVLVANDGDPNGACSDAYYAMFYAARAALIRVGQPERAMGKTHSGMSAAVHEFLAKPGLVDSQLGRAFSFELNRRILADYEEGGVDAEGAADAIASAQTFVAAVRTLTDGAEQGARV